jgi:transcriptional regulator with XRE-family HTH domain
MENDTIVNNDVPAKINHRVKKVRESLKLSQAQFSRIISLSNGYLGGVETEKRKVNDRLVKLICAAFDVDREWLRTGNGSMFTQNAHEYSKVINLYKELVPVYQAHILKQIELMLDIQAKHPLAEYVNN